MTGWASPEQYTAPVEPPCPHGKTLDTYCGGCEWDAYDEMSARPRWTRADWLLLAVSVAAVLAVALGVWRMR